MVLDFSVEAAKLRERSNRKAAATIGPANGVERPVGERLAVDPAPFGSGWYHDAALSEADRVQPRKA